MPDIFKGKAGVQTAIYVFNIGIPHNEKQIVNLLILRMMDIPDKIEKNLDKMLI